MDHNAFPLLTRRQLVELVRKQTGIPLTYSRLMKDGAAGRAPTPVAIFGTQFLYCEEDGLAYARSLLRPYIVSKGPPDTPPSGSAAARMGGRITAPRSRARLKEKAGDQAHSSGDCDPVSSG
jgi:hypothetical protein